MKSILTVVLTLMTIGLFAQDATQAVSIRPVKQVTADSTYWFAEEVYVLYKPAQDSMQVVQYKLNVEEEKKRRLVAEKNALIQKQNQIDSLLASYEKGKGDITESFDSTFVQKITGSYLMQIGKKATNVKLNRNYKIVDDNKKDVGTWKLVSETILTITTEEFETDVEWNEKKGAFISTSKVKLTLIKQKSK